MNLAFGIAMFLFALIGFISIIGAFFAQYKKKSKKPWVISIIISMVLFISSVLLYNSLLTPEQKNSLAAQREQQRAGQSVQVVQDVQKKEKEFPVSPQSDKPIAPEAASPESILTAIADKKLGNSFKKIEVKDFVDDPSKKIVLVHYSGNVGYDNAATKKAMLIQTADLFQEIFTSGVPVQEIDAFIYANMKGSSGSHEGLAMKCQLKSDTAANIKWSDINKTVFDRNLDDAWFAPALNN